MFSRQFPAGYTCCSRPRPSTRETSPVPVGSPHRGSCPDASSCSHNPSGGLPASSGGANVRRAAVNFVQASMKSFTNDFICIIHLQMISRPKESEKKRHYVYFSEVLIGEALQRIDEILLDVDVQRVLELCQPRHGLAHVDQGAAYHTETHL